MENMEEREMEKEGKERKSNNEKEKRLGGKGNGEKRKER